MNQEELRDLLNQKFDSENWKKVVEHVFPNTSFLQNPNVIDVDNDKIVALKQTGTVRLNDEKNLTMFEVQVAESVNIARNKVELRKLVANTIDQEQSHGVLVIYEQGKADYRFTFAAKSTEFNQETSDFETQETDSKRFTYILGENESCKTAAARFYELSTKKDTAKIDDVQDAFSVEKLSKQFFKEYKEHYLAFVNYLVSNTSYKTSIFRNNEKAIRDYVKLLLGRLIFIQFLQKKRWMGVPSTDAGWATGDISFLFNAFKNFQHKGNFNSQFLEPLFFEALSKPNRANDVFDISGTKIPYLNGGLFEKGEIDTSLLNFPESYFNDLFEFFDKYNFTIDENDPEEHEVGIDPEMLGHIFENLLEDNKDKGAFYTPKEIVHYMCQESLTEYLKTYLQEHNAWPTEPDKANELEKALQAFVQKKEAGGVIDFDETLATALRDVKICDPAIGSGAFPMGLLNEIFTCVYALFSPSPDKVGKVWGMNSWQPNVVKKNIIQNSIYGVDIEKGAVDIARLRFWLSLIVDEPEPTALPNLDYKIVVGNSLVSKLDGEVIDIDWTLNDTSFGFFAQELAKEKTALLKRIGEEQKEFFKPESNKHELATDIRNLKIDLLITQLELMIKTKGLEKVDSGETNNNKKKKQTELWLQTEAWKKQIQKLKKFKEKPDEHLHFFDWKLDFPEIMNEQVTTNIGFNIVIGNPPYIGEKGNEYIFQEVLKSRFGKQFYSRWMDYFYFFFHAGINIMKQNGILNFITTNYFFTSTGGVKFRKDLFQRTEILSLINFGDLKIFESATGQHNAITVLKKSNSKKNLALTKTTKQSGISTSKILKSFLFGDKVFCEKHTISQTELFEGDDYQIRIKGKGNLVFNSATINDVLQKVKHDTLLLGNITNITMGIVTLSDTVSEAHNRKFKVEFTKGDGIYVLTNDELENLQLCDESRKKYIKPFFKNSDIKRYWTNHKNKLHLIYIKDFGEPIILPQSLMNHFEKFKIIIKGLKDNFLKNEIAASIVKKWYKNGNYFVLFTPKKEEYFDNEKIVAPYRNKSNIFSYSTLPFYGSKDIAYILPLNNEFSLKYLTCILNSNLIFHWLYNKGKRKGEILEIYKKPLSDIPIKYLKNQNRFIEIFDEISKVAELGKDTTSLQRKIDTYVYMLYNLTYDEVLIVESGFSEYMTRVEYEALKIKL